MLTTVNALKKPKVIWLDRRCELFFSCDYNCDYTDTHIIKFTISVILTT